MDPISPASTVFGRLSSPRFNWQPPPATSTTSTISSSPSCHSPSFASPTSASQHIRFLNHHHHHHRLRSSKPTTAANRAEHTATYNAFAVVAAAAAASPTFPSSPCSPDSASLSPLGLMTVPLPLSEVSFASLKNNLALRPFPPEAVAALLVLAQQLERSSRSPSRSRNTLPPSAFGGKCEAHIRPVLLLDVRTFVRHSESRICSAVNVSIPNALLKRKSFTIDKIRDTLSSKRARSMLRDWSSYANIIIYDANSVTLHDTGVISYISRKFRQENCTAELGWLYGGFDDFSRKYTELCEPSSPLYDPNSSKFLLSSCLSNLSCENLSSQLSPPTTAEEIGKENPPQFAKCISSHRRPANRFDISAGPLTCPSSSTLISEGGGESSNPFAENWQKKNVGRIACRPQTGNVAATPPDNSNRHPSLSSIVSPSVGETVAIRLPACNLEDNEGSEEGSADQSTYSLNQFKRAATLDSAPGQWSSEIGGQNLSEPKSAADGSELVASNHYEAQMNVHHVPQFLKELAIGRDSEEKLAKIFQTIERTEQRRLQSLMLHHARYPTTNHPFSISAGVECGEKNRYVNIWPYDYTRVRLRLKTPPADGVQKVVEDSDYINANFIKAPHCDQTYIATQGPLPATFNDFWNVVWNKGVKVIVMLTREEEGGRIKCHRYWPDEKDFALNYGPAIAVELLDKETLPGGDDSIIRRHFRLQYAPTGATRIIVQLQYIGWPDFGVPETPLAVLQLRAAVLAGPRIREKSIEDTPRSPQNQSSPILVHCSAGCGRTGAFCTIDSTLRLLEIPDGLFGCVNESAIADDIVLAKQEAEMEARNREKAERYEAKLPLVLSAFSTGSFSVAAALKPDPTPDTFCLKMPKFLKGNRRGAAVGQSDGGHAEKNESVDKPVQANRPGAPLTSRNAFSSMSTCFPSERKLSSQPANTELHPPFTPSVPMKMESSAHFKPLSYPNLLPSAESRCTRDIVRGCVEVFREQRLSMVQTLRQFVFCYEAVLWQLMGVAYPGVCKEEIEHSYRVDSCGCPVEETRRPTSPAGTRKAKKTEAEHTCDAPFMCPEYQPPSPEGRSSITFPEGGNLQPSAALFESNSVEPSVELRRSLYEHHLLPTVPSCRTGEATVRQTDPMNLVLPSSIHRKTNRGLDAASSHPRVEADKKRAECSCATGETRADASAAKDVVALSVTSVLPTFGVSHKSSTNFSTADASKSQGTSPGFALQMENGQASPLKRVPLSYESSFNPLGSRKGDHLQGDVLNAVIRTTTEARERESATEARENAFQTHRRSVEKREVEDYFSVKPVISPPLHVSVCVLGEETPKHGASWLAVKPTFHAQPTPRVTDATSMVGKAMVAIQNSTPRTRSPAFVAVPSSLFLIKDAYSRRRSDPCALLRVSHADPVTPRRSASSPSSCHPRPGHHFSEFQRFLSDSTAKGLSMRSHHACPPSNVSGSSTQDHLYHTRSSSAGGAGFVPIGMSPTLLSH